MLNIVEIINYFKGGAKMNFKNLLPTTLNHFICFIGTIITVQLAVISLYLGDLRELLEQILQCIK
ncbi:hypothetical protein [Terrisporobacter sp.]|uniref:hypothetical protein n=1 Tax=Terrisporobacter sp. TaxID=1965305 RepID=UPI002637DCFD|nr:hypothetical protein [Terrisporobacter sp.]